MHPPLNSASFGVLVAPHDAAPFPVHLPRFPGITDTSAAQNGATRVVRARRMSPRLQELLRRPKPALRAFSPPKPFHTGHAGAEKLSLSSTPAPIDVPDLRDASALKFGVRRYVSRPPRRGLFSRALYAGKQDIFLEGDSLYVPPPTTRCAFRMFDTPTDLP